MTMDFTLLSIPSVLCPVETRGIAPALQQIPGTNPAELGCKRTGSTVPVRVPTEYLPPHTKEGGAEVSLPRGIAPGSLKACSGVAKEPVIQGCKSFQQKPAWVVLSQRERKGLLHCARKEPEPSSHLWFPRRS